MNFKYLCSQLIGLILISIFVLVIYFLLPNKKFRSKCGGGIVIDDMKQYDHIILASNVSSFNETNTHSHFKTRLAQKKVFPANENWRVALTEITYKQSWYNIREDSAIRFSDEDGMKRRFPQHLTDELHIDAGFYSNIHQLISKINSKLKLLAEMCEQSPALYVHPESQKVYIFPGVIKTSDGIIIKFIPTFGKDMENLLGFIDEDGCTLEQQILNSPPEKSNLTQEEQYEKLVNKKAKLNIGFLDMKIRGHYPADINAGFNNLYIYSNIVQQSNVGDAFGEILTTVPNKLSEDGFGGSVVHEPKNLVYRELQTRVFDTIEIDITDDRGVEIPFKLGNTVVKLEFVRYD